MGNDLPEGVVNAEPSGGWESGDAADPETTDAETTDAEAADAEATDGSSESAVEGGIRYTPEDAQADAAASGTDARDARGEHDPDVRILPLRPSDAGEVLTIQRAAFVSEAQIYGSADMSPLTQTLAEVEAELEGADGWVARIGGRLVGVIRTRTADDLLLIGRIAIAPDMQGAGIGRRLLAAAEESTGAAEAELFTGSLSEANLRLYRDCGYVETERVDQGDGTAQVFLRKRLRD